MAARRTLLATVLVLVCAGSRIPPAAGVSNTARAPLFPILQDSRWGFMDASGRIVIPPRFESTVTVDLERGVGQTLPRGYRPRLPDLFMAQGVGPESTRAIGVKLGGKWGFVDRDRPGAVESRFDQAGWFSEGLAPVRLGERWGFVDSTGRVAIPPQFDEVGRFLDGVAVVTQMGRDGMIDPEGRFVVRPRFDDIPATDSVFHDDRALFALFGKKGYVSRAGVIVLPPLYDDASRFSEGLAAVRLGDRWGYVDTTGHVVIAPRFQMGGPFDRGLALVMFDDRYGFIDRQGAYVVLPQFDEASSFSGRELAPARKGTTLGLVDRSGNWAMPSFVELSPIDDSLVVGRVDGRTGIVRRSSGEMVVPYRWENVGGFSEGLAPARNPGTRFGFIAPSGALVIPPRFNRVDRFRHGLCKAAAGDTLGYVDQMGRWVWFGRFPGYRGRHADYRP